MELIYDNCCEYNGEDSEYFELAEEIRKLFQTLVGIHFEGKNLSDDKADGQNKKGRRRESRSPSACKTPEFTSESSSEEGSDDEGRLVLIGFACVHSCMQWDSYLHIPPSSMHLK